MESLRVAVLMGGVSSEREISLRSGHAIAAALKTSGHKVLAIDVRGEELRDFLNPQDADIAFIALHGRFGEDGKVQQQCEELGLYYTGSRPKASALALDKVRSKETFRAQNVPTPEYRVLSQAQGFILPDGLVFPVVVKPPLEGSSIGLTIVDEEKNLRAALQTAFQYGETVMIEKFVQGKELTVGILGDEALPVIQIVPRKGVYDYHAKYTAGETEYLVPAPLDRATTQRVQRTAWKDFHALGCEDFGRVDVMLGEDGREYVLEVNTIPGFTQTSLLPKAARALDIGFEALCERILMLGIKNAIST